MAKKRILHEWRLDKIAAVDNPCQEGARVAIMKRKENEEMDQKEHDAAIAKLNGEWQTKLDALTKQVEDVAKLKADFEVEKAKAKMSDDEKEFMEDMKDDEKKKKFLQLTPAERKAEVAKAKSGDETLVVNGKTIRKSVVGADSFDAMKSQEERIKKNEEDIAKANERAEDATIAKRVETEFAHVAGKPEDTAKLLKALAKLPEAERKAGEALLKSNEEMAKGAFLKMGHKREDVLKGQQPFTAKVSEVMARDKISKSAALVKVAEEFPDLYEAYQSAGTDAARNAA